MKNNIALILLLYTYQPVPAQPRIGLEQYYCPGSPVSNAAVTRVFYQSATRNYVEARYNYDAEGTMGLSMGKAYGGGKGPTWQCIPTAGIVAGRYIGFSLGLNAAMDFANWNLSSAIQVTPGKSEGYVYSWSQIGRTFGGKLYVGAALQQDLRFGSGCRLNCGVTAQASIGEWAFPVYIFEPFGKQVWVLAGVTREWTLNKSNNHLKTPAITP